MQMFESGNQSVQKMKVAHIVEVPVVARTLNFKCIVITLEQYHI